MATVAEQPKKEKADPVFWWQLETPPICPKCKIPCGTYCSQLSDNGELRIQHRRCRACGYTTNTVTPVSKPS